MQISTYNSRTLGVGEKSFLTFHFKVINFIFGKLSSEVFVFLNKMFLNQKNFKDSQLLTKDIVKN